MKEGRPVCLRHFATVRTPYLTGILAKEECRINGEWKWEAADDAARIDWQTSRWTRRKSCCVREETRTLELEG